MGNETATKVAMVVGVGPGLGAALCKRFARAGYAVAMLARRVDALLDLEREVVTQSGGRALAIAADASDAGSVARAFERTRRELGAAPDAMVYNASGFVRGGVLDVAPEAFEQAWRTSCLGAFHCARAALPAMLERGRGTLLFTGATASRRGGAGFAGLAVGKFGVRALAESLAREFGPRGVHVAHVVIDGQIDTPAIRAMMPGRAPSTLLSPDALAETYYQLHTQDPTAWTLELDVRPSVEKF